MLIYVLQAIEEVALEGLPPDGLELDPDCTIISDRDSVLDFVDAAQCEDGRPAREVIGEIARDTIRKAAALTFVPQESETDISDASAPLLLMRVMALTQQFLFCLWLIRDNSGNTGDGVIFLRNPATGIRAVFSQRPAILNFTADCDRRPTHFTSDDVASAAGYFGKIHAITPQVEWRFDAPRPSALVYESRLLRAIYFAQAARASADIGVKVAFCCICFESLFSTEQDALSHRIAERTAVFLGGTGNAKRDVYKNIRALYGVRSKVVHGSHLKASQIEALRVTTQRGDEHLRKCLRVILDDASMLELFSRKRSEAIDAFLFDKLMPPDPAESADATPAQSVQGGGSGR